MIELKDTVELMCSDDWKKRLVAEYAQAKIRYRYLRWHMHNVEYDWPYNPKKETHYLRMIIRLEGYCHELADRVQRNFNLNRVINIEAWIDGDEPLTLFDEEKEPTEEEPIKLNGYGDDYDDDEAEWNSAGNGRGFLSQTGTDTAWGLESPIFDTKEEAVKAWNKMVRKMNGDE